MMTSGLWNNQLCQYAWALHCTSQVCSHGQNFLDDIYCHIYRVDPATASVEFILTPMPRLEVESVNDLKVLFEIGALTPDMSVELSRVLLGNAANSRNPKISNRSKKEEPSPDSIIPGSNNNNDNKNNNDKTDTKGFKDGKNAKRDG